MCSTSTQDQLECLVKNGCIDVLGSFLNEENIDQNILSHIVDGLDSLLYHGWDIQKEKNLIENPYGVYLEERRYLNQLEKIMNTNENLSNSLTLQIEELINKIRRTE